MYEYAYWVQTINNKNKSVQESRQVLQRKYETEHKSMKIQMFRLNDKQKKLCLDVIMCSKII